MLLITNEDAGCCELCLLTRAEMHSRCMHAVAVVRSLCDACPGPGTSEKPTTCQHLKQTRGTLDA